MQFADMGLSPEILRAVEESGYTQPTPIQREAIPLVLAGRDVQAAAQTGTGKTAAFVLPMLARIQPHTSSSPSPAMHPVRLLILAPTRELADQVYQNARNYAKYLPIRVAVVYGGIAMQPQVKELHAGVDVLIATPGRLLDHVEQKTVNLSRVQALVLDEADRMLDMGFIPDIERICKLVPFTRQTLFFTATMPPEIRRITDTFLHNPQKVEVSRPASTAVTVTQLHVGCGREAHEKRDILRQLIRGAKDLKNAIIFCNRKREVALLHRSLQKHGFGAVALHGDMEQPARMAALDQFRKGESPLLVASDVAARGLDIPEVSHVFNFDVPHHPDDYVHRIGRTGRAGRLGTAISIVSPADQKSLGAIEKLIGQTIPKMEGAPEASSATEGESASSARPPRDDRRSSGDRKPRRERDGRRGGKRDRKPDSAADNVAALQPPPSIGRVRNTPAASHDAAAEAADHSHLPAFLLRPVRARV